MADCHGVWPFCASDSRSSLSALAVRLRVLGDQEMAKTKLRKALPARAKNKSLPKALTGIRGFDEITQGGLPRGRPTLVCGGPGCGKTIFGVEFLVRGIQDFDEPGVFVAFEETSADLSKNVASLGYDLERLTANKQLAVDYVHLDPSDIEETGGYSLDGLFVRLELAVRTVKAKRIVIDTLEVLLANLKDEDVVRGELQRLFRWLKERELTAVITAERGEGKLTRNGLEEYVSDCVISLDQRTEELLTTRRMRVVKYRGSSHGADEYPFLIDEDGISVLPMTSVLLDYDVSPERLSTGMPDLDVMLGGKGYYRTSTILLSGSAGTGKSSLAAMMADASCARGERVIVFALEESPSQIVRNMRSVNLDLAKWIKQGLLRICATRPSFYGLEMHLLKMHKQITDFQPRLVILDPISSLINAGSSRDVKSMMVRLFDSLKMQQITGLMTYLNTAGATEETEVGISSLIDTWLEVRDVEMHGERTRALYVIKSRGMGHSNQVRELVLTSEGARLLEVYPGPDGVLTGSARAAQDVRFALEQEQREQAANMTERLLVRKEAALRAKIAALEAEFASEAEAARSAIRDTAGRAEREQAERRAIGKRRTLGSAAGRPLRPNGSA
jgi:circadian clock protein KaiC